MGLDTFHTLNALTAPIQERGKDAFGDILRGYEASQKPGEMARKRQEELYKNKLLGEEANLAGPMAQAKLKQLQAQGKTNEEMLAEAMGIKRDTPEFNQAISKMLKDKNTSGGSRSLSEGARMFSAMPQTDRMAMLAQARAWGYNDDETILALYSGKSINDLKEAAKATGVDVDNAPKIYNPTTSNITQTKNRVAIKEEVKYLENKTTDALKDYSRKFLKYSPTQVYEAIKNKNPDSQAKALAARALQPELAILRTRMAGGTIGIEAINQMVEKSLGNFKVFESLVSPEVFEKTQRYMNDWLSTSVDKATSSMYNEKPREQYNQGESDYSSISDEEIMKIIGGR